MSSKSFEVRIKELKDQVKGYNDQIAKIDGKFEVVLEKIGEVQMWIDDNPPPPSEKEGIQWAGVFRKQRCVLESYEGEASDLRTEKASLENTRNQKLREIDKQKKLMLEWNKQLWRKQREEHERKLQHEEQLKIQAKAQPTIDKLRAPVTAKNVDEVKRLVKLWDGQPRKWQVKYPGVRFPREVAVAKKRILEYESLKVAD